MTYRTNSKSNVRTFIVSLLTYAMLTIQLAPMAGAANGSALGRATAKAPDVGRESSSEPQQKVQFAPLPAPVPGPTVPAGGPPNIVATKTDNRTPAQPAAPGDTINYTVVITNNGLTAATGVVLTDTIDANTTLVPNSIVSTPIANADTYNVIGNVRIQPNTAQGLLANDFNPDDGNATGITASGPTTTAQSGNLTINADGSFSYNPAPGFAGTDTFTYTLTVTATGKTDTATVTLLVGNGTSTPGTNVIWFINASAPAGGDGRLTSPFNCFVGAGCFSAVAADDPGDAIFLFNGAYIGGWPFLANQKLIGQGAGATLASLSGVTVQAYSDALPVTNGNPDNVTMTTVAAATNALTVSAGGILLRGFAIGNTTGAKILGSSFGTLTVGNTATPDVRLTGTGQALNLTTGAFAATSAFTSVATTSSGTQGITLAGITGTVAFNGTQVSGSTTQGILIGTTTADINFGNTTVTGATDGVSFQNNSSGTRTFGALTVSGGSGDAFLHGAGGGNVTVTGAATLSSTLDPIEIQNAGSGQVINFAGGASVNKSTAGGEGVHWSGTNTGATLTFNSLSITTTNVTGNTAGLTASGGGTINVTNGTGSIASSLGPAISATGIALNANFANVSSAGSTIFGVGLTTVTGTSNFGGGSLNTAAGSTFFVSGGTATVTYSGGVTQATNQPLVSLGGGHATGTITFQSGTLSATSGTGLQFDNADGTYNFNGTTTLNGGDAGVDIFNGSAGTFTFASGVAITNPSGIAYREDTSTATINYNGTITKTNSANNAVDINAKTGGATTFSGAISATTTTANAIDLTNTGGTVTFRGGMVVSTTSGVGFNATGAGATVNVCDENPCVPASTGALVNTLTSTTGTALNVSNTTIGANRLEFRSISANGGANGIFLQNTTGTTGGLTVVGDGTNTTKGGNGTGGTIQNMNGADGATSGIGIYLNNTANVVLRRMSINGTIQNLGLYGETVNNLTMQYCTLGGTVGTSSGSNDAVFAFGKTTPGGANGFANGSVSTIDNCLISGGIEHNVEIHQQANTASLTISNSNITNNSAALGSDGILIETHTDGNGGTPFAQLTVSVQGCLFDNNKSQAVQANALGDSFLNLTLNLNTIQKTAQGNEGFVLQVGGDADMTTHVTSNTFTGILGTNILVGQVVNNASNLSNLIGVIQNNNMTVGNATTFPTNRTLIVFFSSTPGLVSTANVLVDANTINTFSDPVNGIAEPLMVSTPDANTDPSFTATVTNNVVNINDPAGTSLRGIAIQSIQNVSAGCIDVRGNDVNYTPAAPVGVNGIRVRQVAPATLQMEQGSSAGAPATVLASNNPLSTTEVVGTVTVVSNSTCQTAPTAAEELTADNAPTNSPSADIVKETFEPSDRQVERAVITGDQVAMPKTFAAGVKGQIVMTKPDEAVKDMLQSKSGGTKQANDGNKSITPTVANFPLTIGTLQPGKSVTVTFSVTVNTPLPGGVTTVSNQGTVSGSNFGSVLTDDPDVAGANNPTVTNITAPPDISARDAAQPEPAVGQTNMIFTVALSTPAPAGGVTVNFTTADEPAGPGKAVGGVACGGSVDYVTTVGSLGFATGQQVQTIPVPICSDASAEPAETFLLNLSSPVGGNISDGTATGTITPNTPGTFLISELRTSGPGGLGDDFVEFYNNTDSPLTVAASDASAGYGVYKLGADCATIPVLIATIPNGTVIPARGHYLVVGSQYSLAAYAVGNLTMTSDIESDRNVAVFTTASVIAISSANRLDGVGFDLNPGGNICALLREGTPLASAAGSTSQHSFVRKLATGLPQDTNDNAVDFVIVAIDPTVAVGGNASPLLGAPGPENIASPIQRNGTIKASLIDTAAASSAPPNRIRDNTSFNDTLTPSAPNGGAPASNPYTLGTLLIRRKFTNNTGAAVTRLRFRIVDITSTNAPPGGAGQSDLRALSSLTSSVATGCCGTVTVQGLTLEQPPTQARGGGLNSSLAAGTVTLGTPLANGASLNVNLLLGVATGGSFRFFINVEALP